MIINLQRDLRTPNETLGVLTAAGRRWPSIELPWVPSALGPCGEKGRSCVPPGTYRLERHTSDAHPKVWALVNPALLVFHWPWDVPTTLKGVARDVCLVHPANWATQLDGCLAIGKMRVKEATGYWKVTDSRDAVNELRSVIGSTADLQLIIEEPEGL